MNTKRISYKKLLASIIALMMILTLLPQTAFAEGESETYPDSEWWNFRNNDDNNGITDKETPTSDKTAYLKWAKKYGANYTESVAPPIIVGGYIYSASRKNIYKIDKETGEQLAEEPISGNFGYAMNPIVYAEGKLFLQIGNGQIEAKDVNTLETLWVSERIGGQTISPITYKNGFVYTGMWNSETKDGAYIGVSASATEDIVENEDGSKTKKITWKLEPSVGVTTKGGVTSEGGVSSPRGFYWAGSYATDNYVVFGSDDGARAYDYPETAMLYSVNPKTGMIIDTLEGIKGDIRTTIVHNDGYLYFATKGSYMYKVRINSDGTFDGATLSHIDTGGAMTASPVVYNGRIYLGVSGASQFDPDSNHIFAVISDDEMLSQNSFIYSVPIPGYPQAASLLSTQEVDETGDVYVYFAYNAFPGGIYCLKDNAGQTTGSAFSLFTPPQDMQQYCISTICTDNEGTLYYKNDSAYLMAVETNLAYIEDIKVTPDKGESEWGNDFTASISEYVVKVPSNSLTADVELKLPAGVSATVNNKSYSGKYTCDLSSGSQVLEIKTEKGGQTRAYTVKVVPKSMDSSLSEMKVTLSNSYTGNELKLRTEPFDPAVLNQKTEIYNVASGTTVETFTRLWLASANSDAEITVHPVANVANSSDKLNEDGTIKGVYVSGVKRDYYPIYFTSGKTYSKVRVDVTSEDGSMKTSYYLTIYRDPSISDIGEPGVVLDSDNITVYSKGPGNAQKLNAKVVNYLGGVSWESDNSSIATVGDDGTVKGIKPGTTIIRADCGKASAECKVTIKAPTLSLSSSKITLTAGTKGKITAKVNGYSGQKVEWKITKGSNVATVDTNGNVTAKKAGTAVVTATSNGVSKNCTITVKNKAAPKKFKAKAQKKKAKLSWSKSSDVTKYQVAYKKKGSKKWKYKIVSSKKKSVTIKKLKGGKKYQFKIRSYKTVSGKKIYSKWSKTKTVKIKK